MPIVQPHQNKFRVFLLIAQLMVRKLFLGAHFKMPFCWLSSLDVSIHQREIADYCLCIILMCLDIIIRNQQKNYQKWQMWQKLKVFLILTSHSSLGSTRTGFPQLSAQIKCNELCSNNSQCDDICNSKACAYENLDCNEKLRKLVSLFLRCTPQKKPSAMPIVQPHQNKFRVFLLIAQLMVRKLFLGAHFKMPFCWLSSLDVSIHQREIADYCLCIILMCLDIIIRNQQKNYQKWQMWQKLKVLLILTSHSSLGSTRTSFPQLSTQIKCNEISSNNSQCDDTCNSKACAYDNLDCNEKLRKLVS